MFGKLINLVKKIKQNYTGNSKKIFLTFLNYYIFTFVNAIISILSLGFITNLLDPKDFGYIGIYNSILFFIPSLVTFSNQSLQTIEIVRLDKTEYLDFRNRSITFIIFNFIIFLPIVSYFINLFPNYIFVIIGSYTMAFLMSISNILNTELINNQEATKYGVFTTLTQILILIFSIISLKYLKLGWHFRIYSFIFAETMVLIIRVYFYSDFVKKYKFKLTDLTKLTTFYIYGIPLILYVMIGWVLNQSDRYFLLKYFTLKEVGYYTIAASFSSLIVMINSNLMKVATPVLYKKLKNNNSNIHYNKIFLSYAFIILIITSIYCFFLKKIIPNFLNEKYVDSLFVIYLLCYAQAFFGIYSLASISIDFYKKNIEKTIIIILSTIQIVILNMTLVPIFGYLSAAYSMLITFITLSILMFGYSKLILKNNLIIEKDI